MKPETLDRCRNAFTVLSILLDREPTQSEVARAAPASKASVTDAWPDLIADDEDKPQQVLVEAPRCCLSCEKSFLSQWSGNRRCPKCRGLETWQTGVSDHAVMLPF